MQYANYPLEGNVCGSLLLLFGPNGIHLGSIKIRTDVAIHIIQAKICGWGKRKLGCFELSRSGNDTQIHKIIA